MTDNRETFLSRILKKKRERLAAFRAEKSIADLRQKALETRKSAVPHFFKNRLQHPSQTNIIAEFKRRSPSKGAISAGAEPQEIAAKYLTGGAAAISVLTEEDFFGGSIKDLQIIVETASGKIPVLCKDFVFDEAQIYQAAIAGASAILLIVAAFEENAGVAALRRIIEEDLKMDALVEVHTAEEMRRAGEIKASIIGVNNRDLKSFEISIETSVELQKLAPPDAVLVSESGLRSREQIERLREIGFDAFLIGESLMRAAEPEITLRELIG